ncbi:hypothetical protein TWF102_003584 [Orbilia oligospora]|uniref:Uncharacterized protein n=1 Tax=Orbilia oligospora TaxID=2813651 RepID=A0A7C8MUD7_ORBOL|nr:hypothetical protein TWF102_003584 [Orbilia oligospora]KAF3080332.1 hypothetical protein TWF103_004204 [Orbilia oligospora]
MCPTSGSFCFVFYTLNRVRSGIGDIEEKKPPTACMLRMPGFPSAFEETSRFSHPIWFFLQNIVVSFRHEYTSRCVKP